MRRTSLNVAAFALGLALPLLMAQVGGFPSRPRFQAVGIGIVAPATVGALSQTGNVNANVDHVIDNDSNGTANQARLNVVSGDASAAFVVAGSGNTAALVTNGPTGAQSVLRTLGAHPLVLGTNNTYIADFDSFGNLNMVGGARQTSLAPTLRFDESDATATNRVWRVIADAEALTFQTRTDADGAGAAWLAVNRTGTVVDSVALTGTAFTMNAVDMTPESGTFTASFVTACTTTPTATFDYQKVGNIVSLGAVSTSGFPCTSDSTSFLAATALPVSIRPLAGGGTGWTGSILTTCTDNSVASWCQIIFEADGDIAIARCATFGAACSTTGWTAALNKSSLTNVPVMSYMLGNP